MVDKIQELINKQEQLYNEINTISDEIRDIELKNINIIGKYFKFNQFEYDSKYNTCIYVTDMFIDHYRSEIVINCVYVYVGNSKINVNMDEQITIKFNNYNIPKILERFIEINKHEFLEYFDKGLEFISDKLIIFVHSK